MHFNHIATVPRGVPRTCLKALPPRVAADGPPERTGAPEAEAEDEAGGDQSDGRLARILAVTKTEEDRQDERGGPVAKSLVMVS